MIMKFLIYGPSWRGGTPSSITNALQQLGHEVVLFDYIPYLFRKKIGGKIGAVMDIVCFRYIANAINQDIQSIFRDQKFDVLMICGGLHIWPETVKEARKYCRWVINWNWDEFFNPVYSSPYIESAFREYGLILTPRKHLITEYYKRGAQEVKHIDFCFDSAIHYPVTISAQEKKLFGSQVVFVGSWSRRREAVISKLKNYIIKIWGASWKHVKRSFRNIANIDIMGRTAECEDMSRVFNASKICLNILTLENRDQTNVRNYEILACGAFQLCERTEALLELFKEGKEVACYSSNKELIEKINYYLNHENERIAIANAGYKKIITGRHTYQDRLIQVINFLQ